MKTLSRKTQRLLPAQEIYFDMPSAPRQSWCMSAFCAALLLTTLFACFLPVASPAARTFTPAEMAAYKPRPVAQDTKARKVFHQDGSRYHWHFECPLANHRPLRPIAAAVPEKKRVYLTPQAATAQKLMPCRYCEEAEMEF